MNKKHPKLYYIEQKVESGWRRVDIAISKSQAKEFKKAWKKYFGWTSKIRIRS